MSKKIFLSPLINNHNNQPNKQPILNKKIILFLGLVFLTTLFFGLISVRRYFIINQLPIKINIDPVSKKSTDEQRILQALDQLEQSSTAACLDIPPIKNVVINCPLCADAEL